MGPWMKEANHWPSANNAIQRSAKWFKTTILLLFATRRTSVCQEKSNLRKMGVYAETERRKRQYSKSGLCREIKRFALLLENYYSPRYVRLCCKYMENYDFFSSNVVEDLKWFKLTNVEARPYTLYGQRYAVLRVPYRYCSRAQRQRRGRWLDSINSGQW